MLFPSRDVSMVAKSWWEENPNAEQFGNACLDLSNKRLTRHLFGLLDRTGDGIISLDDFQHLKAGEQKQAQHNFLEILSALDAKGVEITGLEFLDGLKKLAIKEPVSTLVTAETFETHDRMLEHISLSLNAAFQKVSLDLLENLIVIDDAAKASLEQAWARLDVDRDGRVTVRDFAGDTDGKRKWESIQSLLDQNADGQIETHEFLSEAKRSAIRKVSAEEGCFGKADIDFAAFNEMVNQAVHEWCDVPLGELSPNRRTR